MAVEMLKDVFKAGPAGKCAGCPFAGSCSPCRPQAVFGESGSGGELVFNSAKEVLALRTLPVGRIYFDTGSASRESSKPLLRASEKTCTKCYKSASTCTHSLAA